MRRLVTALFLLLTGCAPVTSMVGPAVTSPHLTDQAFVTADGATLPLRVWLPVGAPRAVIIALHGFNDYSNAFELPAPSLTAAGIAVYAYDQRGFGGAPDRGLWPGEQALHQDLYTMIRLAAARHAGTPLFVLGESMGGAVALTALSHPAIDQADIPPLAGVLLVAPAVWSRDEMPWYQSAALWVGSRTLPWMTLTGRGLHIMASDNIEMLRRLSRDPLVIKETRIDAIKGLCDLMDDASVTAARFDLPALVLIGTHDEVVPGQASDAMLARLPKSAQPKLYPQGYHMLLRDLHADLPLADIASWVLADQR